MKYLNFAGHALRLEHEQCQHRVNFKVRMVLRSIPRFNQLIKVSEADKLHICSCHLELRW